MSCKKGNMCKWATAKNMSSLFSLVKCLKKLLSYVDICVPIYSVLNNF